jgi:1,2-dihydroxy-3-keto-5-methylthiopentene dioxygenase
MSSLTVYNVDSPEQPNKVLTHAEDIASTLATHNVLFERWTPSVPIQPGVSEDDLIAAYKPQIDRLVAKHGYMTVDVISVDRDDPDKAERRAQYLGEHRLGEGGVRFFVAGRGLFTLHIDDYVYAVLCEKGDLISIPAGTRHWFDMGENPYFVVIRLYNSADGWLANYTGDPIAEQFPRLED